MKVQTRSVDVNEAALVLDYWWPPGVAEARDETERIDGEGVGVCVPLPSLFPFLDPGKRQKYEYSCVVTLAFPCTLSSTSQWTRWSPEFLSSTPDRLG